MPSNNNPSFFAKASLVLMLCVMFLHAHSSQAMSLMEAYRSALSHDPIYRSAQHENAAGQESREIGRSAILPSAGLSYGYASNSAELTRNGNTDPYRYDSKMLSLTVRQPLFSPDALARYKQGAIQSDYSDAVFTAKSQELMVRLVSAYLETLAAGDQVRLLVAQRDALVELQEVNRRRLDKGEGTKTEVLETRARAELAQAQLLEAKDTHDNAMRKLRAIIGKDIDSVRTLPKTMSVFALQPVTIQEWEALARDNNPFVRARRYLVDSSEQDVKKNQAGHLPRIELVASHSRSISDSVLLYNQQTVVNSVGIQLNLPIFSGGATSAGVRQGSDLLSKSRADLDESISNALIEIRRQYNLLVSSQARIEALFNAESSAQEALIAMRKSIIGGLRINVDLLNAQQQLYSTQRDLAQARYGYLLAYMRLHDAAGLLTEDSLQKIDREFLVAADATVEVPATACTGARHAHCKSKPSEVFTSAALEKEQSQLVLADPNAIGDEAVLWGASKSGKKKTSRKAKKPNLN
jgi:protease secretion system outer membrane protein